MMPKRNKTQVENPSAKCPTTTVFKSGAFHEQPKISNSQLPIEPIATVPLDDILIGLQHTIAVLYSDVATDSPVLVSQSQDFKRRLRIIDETIRQYDKQEDLTDNQRDAIDFCKELFDADFAKLLDERNTTASDDSKHQLALSSNDQYEVMISNEE